MCRVTLGLLLSLAIAKSSLAEGNRQPRPFFVIAHMVNSIPEIHYFLRQGANAVEVDVNFSPNGSVQKVYHGLPCDCYRRCSLRTPFDAYLDHLHKMRKSNDRRLVLLMLDLKLDELESSPEILRSAGGDVFRKLVNHLWRGAGAKDRLNVLTSIQRVEQKAFFEGFLSEMRKEGNAEYGANIAFDVGMNSDPKAIESMYNSLGIKDVMWQGDGITNCLVEMRPEDRLRTVLDIRDSPTGYVRKVYYWTVDMTLTMEQILGKGVDALITNRPERVVSLIQKNPSLFRLADARDSPWAKIILDNSTTTQPRDPGYGIYNTLENFSELASQAGDYLMTFINTPGAANQSRNL